jgi:Glycosyl transferase family 2/HlyD family secretion protein
MADIRFSSYGRERCAQHSLKINQDGEFMPINRAPARGAGAANRLAWRPLQRSTRVAILGALLATIFYQSFLLRPEYRGPLWLWAAMLLAEGLTALHAVGTWWTILANDERPEPVNATVSRHQLLAGAKPATVDVFITAYGEAPELVRRTVRAARDMELRHQTWVLDDGESDELERICAEEGVGYLRRPTRDHAKAGNINSALRGTSGEYVAIFDADHVPDRNFLIEVLPHFHDPDVAFVQSPQYYVNRPARTEQTYRATSGRSRRSRLRGFLRGLRTAVVVLVLLAAAVFGGMKIARDRVANRAYLKLDNAALTAQPVRVGANVAGSVTDVRVTPQSEVSRGQELARVSVTGPDGSPDTQVLKAPVTGVVSEVNVASGGAATPGQPILTLYDPARLTFQAKASVDDLRRLRLGMRANLAAEDDGGRIPARLDRVEPQVGGGRTGRRAFTVVFVPDKSAAKRVGELVPGLPFTATVDTKTAPDGAPAVTSTR